MPEPFSLGILLTFVALVLAWTLTPATAEDVLVAWGGGLSALLSFITQICLTLLFTITLVRLGQVPRWLARLAQVPKTSRVAYAYVAAFAGCVSLVAWPLGPIVGGLMARRVALAFRERGTPIHYPLLAGAAFSGFVVWHMGYSGSAPLLVATEGNPMQEILGGVLPVSRTTLAPFNLVAIVATLASVALAAAFAAFRGSGADPDAAAGASWNNVATVAWESGRGLRPGMTVQFLLNGEPLGGPTTNPVMATPPLDRGEHRAAAELRSAGGETVATTDPVVFFIKQQSRLINPPPRPQPSGGG